MFPGLFRLRWVVHFVLFSDGIVLYSSLVIVSPFVVASVAFVVLVPRRWLVPAPAATEDEP